MNPSLRLRLAFFTAASAPLLPLARAQTGSFPVAIEVNASDTGAAVNPVWRFFGCDEPNYATMTNGRKLIGELGELRPKEVYFRTHNLLTSGDGKPALKWGSTNAYTEDARGNPVYNWAILDGIFDTYLANGVKPYVEIGFMPEALSITPEPYQHHWAPGQPYGGIVTGWAYPPKDYAKWGELAYQWTKHCVERYGRTEVESWYWEVWNEANGSYWKGKPEDFHKLHDFAIAGVRRALPTARVGGADSAGAGGAFTKSFIEHCLHGTNYATGQVGTPLDFVSFHAKGSPRFVDGHVRMGISHQLRDFDSGFGIVASYPETKSLPIIVGESDPDGCAACTGPQLGYRNTPLYAAYTAEAVARAYELADRHGVNLTGTLTWAFEFEDHPFFAGYRVLGTNGIDLPVLNVFRLFSQLGGRRVSAHSSEARSLDEVLKNGVAESPDVSVVASREAHKLNVLVWHYHDDDIPGDSAAVSLALTGLPAGTHRLKVTHYSVDEHHSNAFTAWKDMGSPAQPTPAQYAQLEAAGKLGQVSETPKRIAVMQGKTAVNFILPRQAVALLTFEEVPADAKP
jgi:xylan 1,4-beta-xylosidase